MRCETAWCVGEYTGRPLSIISYVSGSTEELESRKAELARFRSTLLGCPRWVGYVDKVVRVEWRQRIGRTPWRSGGTRPLYPEQDFWMGVQVQCCILIVFTPFYLRTVIVPHSDFGSVLPLPKLNSLHEKGAEDVALLTGALASL